MSQSLVWYHGTNVQKFSSWSLPAPAKDALCPPSPALFFTQDMQYARGAGSNLCEVTLDSAARVLQPGSGGPDSAALRNSLMQDEFYGKCLHLASQQAWESGWQSGFVMRCSFHPPAQKAVVEECTAKLWQQIKLAGLSVPVNTDLSKVALQYMTREWIDLICKHAKLLGHQVLIGAEVDQWYGPDNKVAMPPIARSWMAVLDAKVITAPHWI